MMVVVMQGAGGGAGQGFGFFFLTCRFVDVVTQGVVVSTFTSFVVSTFTSSQAVVVELVELDRVPNITLVFSVSVSNIRLVFSVVVNVVKIVDVDLEPCSEPAKAVEPCSEPAKVSEHGVVVEPCSEHGVVEPVVVVGLGVVEVAWNMTLAATGI